MLMTAVLIIKISKNHDFSCPTCSAIWIQSDTLLLICFLYKLQTVTMFVHGFEQPLLFQMRDVNLSEDTAGNVLLTLLDAEVFWNCYINLCGVVVST